MSETMDVTRKRVLLIAPGKGIIINNLVEHFNKSGYEVMAPQLKVTALSKEEKCGVLLVYCDPDIVDDKELMIYLADLEKENDMLIYAIGSADELATCRKYFSNSNYQLEFERPINVSEASEQILNDISENFSKITKKILVVDDSGTMLRKIKGWLENKYHLVLANSGARAMKALAIDVPDLVLLDYEMPIVDGKQVLEMMRAEPEYEKIPVIFLTGKSDKQSVIDVMALKPEGYILKSQDSMQIIKQIDDFFEKQKGK